MVKTYYQMLTKLKFMIKNLQKLTMNSMVAYSQLLFFFFVKIIQVKDMENDKTNVCFFFLNLRKIKLMNIEETVIVPC